MTNSSNRPLWLWLAVSAAFAAVLIFAGCGEKTGNEDPCAVNPSAQGCSGYCPSTQSGCPGYVDPGAEPGDYCGAASGADFTESKDGLDIDMVFVKCGAKKIGCTNDPCDLNERYAHTVNLSSYYIGRYPVTQRQWKAVMGTNPSNFVGDGQPVETVSWNDAQDFISALNAKTGGKYRLPTNAEWEYAARGGAEGGDYLYPGSNTVDDVAWHSGNSGGTTHPVGGKLPNELGLYDMGGNVFEWVNDRYQNRYPQESPVGAPFVNPQGPDTGSTRVIRGGSWAQGETFCRVSARTDEPPASPRNLIGFRLALTAE